MYCHFNHKALQIGKHKIVGLMIKRLWWIIYDNY